MVRLPGADALLAVMSAALLASARGSVCGVLPPAFFVGASPNFERTVRVWPSQCAFVYRVHQPFVHRVVMVCAA